MKFPINLINLGPIERYETDDFISSCQFTKIVFFCKTKIIFFLYPSIFLGTLFHNPGSSSFKKFFRST